MCHMRAISDTSDIVLMATACSFDPRFVSPEYFNSFLIIVHTDKGQSLAHVCQLEMFMTGVKIFVWQQLCFLVPFRNS